MQCESSGKIVFPIFQFQDSMHDIMLVADLHVQFTTYHQPSWVEQHYGSPCYMYMTIIIMCN